ncbi:MAG: glycosyltransferase [Bacteroidetes bacterium]|nr:glycosyltransferase [Bacteroidota bacterium]
MPAFISICIPAYKNTDYLVRLLNSIKIQTYKDFEVIISDDSDNNDIEELSKSYNSFFAIKYIRNNPALGSPENWNNAIREASGIWIKMMHYDDWFNTPDALLDFANATKSGYRFICSSYNIVSEISGKIETRQLSENQFNQINNNPFLLYQNNVLGPPSVTMVHKNIVTRYDNNMQWLVDIDYYINILLTNKGHYISTPLVCMSLNAEQLTNVHFNNAKSELQESLMLWNKHQGDMIRDIRNYDSWWRMVRNVKLKNIDTARQYSISYTVPPFLNPIINLQNKLPSFMLFNGIFSKFFMSLSYYFQYRRQSK